MARPNETRFNPVSSKEPARDGYPEDAGLILITCVVLSCLKQEESPERDGGSAAEKAWACAPILAEMTESRGDEGIEVGVNCPLTRSRGFSEPGGWAPNGAVSWSLEKSIWSPSKLQMPCGSMETHTQCNQGIHAQ